MENIIKFNRKTLINVSKWIEESDYNSPPSLFNYGLPKHVFHLIDKDVSNELTECDIICYFITLFNNLDVSLNYLEIGVSVGKTFYQISEFSTKNVENYSLSCLDIEAINPSLYNLLLSNFIFFSKTECIPNVEKEYIFEMAQKSTNVITKLVNDKNNEVTYFESNSFDKNIWKEMKQYNLIFSDGYHNPVSLLNECTNLISNNLIDLSNFVYCFDDLEHDKGGNMWQAVIQIYERLKLIANKPLFLKHHVVNGWLGNNESKHNFGVISSFDYNL